MKLFEIVLVIACALFVIGVITTSIIRKKQGKCSCDCGGDCSHCKACMYAKTNKRQ